MDRNVKICNGSGSPSTMSAWNRPAWGGSLPYQHQRKLPSPLELYDIQSLKKESGYDLGMVHVSYLLQSLGKYIKVLTCEQHMGSERRNED